MLEDLYKALHQGTKAYQTADNLQGRTYGLQLGVVLRTDDPDNLGRIQVLLPSKAARSETDWLYRLTPWYGVSQPDPECGAVGLAAFLDGDPHRGVWLGVITNDANPFYGSRTWRFQHGDWVIQAITPEYYSTLVDQTQILQERNQITLKVGNSTLVLSDGKLELSGMNSVTINGKEVATLTAKDDDGDHLITRGW